MEVICGDASGQVLASPAVGRKRPAPAEDADHAAGCPPPKKIVISDVSFPEAPVSQKTHEEVRVEFANKCCQIHVVACSRGNNIYL